MEPRAPHTSVLDRLERAEQLKIDGKHDAALEILVELLVEDPENVSALEEVADNELSLGRDARAEVAASRAVTLDCKSYTGHYILGFLRMQETKWEAAISHLQQANHGRPNTAEILRCLGWCLFWNNDRLRGLVTLERALNIEDDNPLTFVDLGMCYAESGNFGKAKLLFLRAKELDPSDERADACLQRIEELERKTMMA